ncbi:cache modulated two component system sensor histidine kinase [Desulfosarcina variabilis str. Montpellier]|uniref:PAS domain S-box protein n=1 Tax=Desulfosarcina variabilis TaxID=2300 RepID=UPI003AFB5A75
MESKNAASSRNLGTTLTLAFVTMSVAALLFSGFVGIIFLIQTQKEAVAGKQHVVARQAADAVAGFIQDKFIVMEAAVRLTGSARERENALQALLGMEPAFRQLLLLNTENEALFRASRMSQIESGRLDQQLGADPFRRVSAGQRHIGAVYVDQVTSEPLVILSVPVTTLLGDRLGALLAEVNLKFIWELVDRLRVGETGHAYVVDRKGRLIAFGETGRVLRGETLDHLSDVAAFIDQPEKKENIDVHTFVGITGKKVVGTYVPLGDPDWAVMTELPVMEAYRPVIRNGLISIIVLLCISALAGWLGILLARRLATPIVDLTRTADRVADGELDVRAQMNGPTEVIHLSAAFNQMTRQLRGMLDQEAERTRTLEREISKRRRTEKFMRITQFSFDHANIGIYRIASDGRILEVNPKAADLLGYTREELRTLSICDIDTLVTPENWDLIWRELVDAGTFFYERQHRRKDGTLIPVEIYSNLLEYEDRQYAIAFVQNISERKQMEQAIKDNEEHLKDLVSNVPGVVYQYKADPNALRTNSLTSVVRERTVEILGLDSEKEEFFNHFVACLPEEDQPRFVKSVKDAFKAVSPWYYEGRFTKPSGEKIWFEGRSIPRRIKGEIVFYGMLTDITRRKEMESSLRFSQFIFDKAAIGIFLLGKNGEFLNVNEEAGRFLGYSREELCKMSVFDIDTQFMPEEWTLHMADLRIHGVKTIETLIRHKNGKVFPVQVIDNVMTFEDQEFHVAFVQDITERKQAEKNLRENEQLLGNILESMNEGVFVLDSEFKNKIYNKSMEIITNVPREAVIGKRPWEAFPHIKNSPIEEKIRNVMKGEVGIAVEVTHPHNPTVWSRDSFSPLKDTDGRVIGVVGVLTEITRQKDDEEKLRRLRNYLSNIIDSMPSILVTVDRDGHVTQWNHRAEQSTGLSFETVRFQPLTNVFPRLAGEMERVHTSIRERRVISSPKVSHKVENETRFEDITIFPLVANGVEGAVIRVDDVTQQVRLHEMMIQNEKMLSVGGLAAGMAHEINNPLAGILQNTSVLENRLFGDLPANQNAAEAVGTTLETIRQYLALRNLPEMIGSIRDSGNRAATIVKNMLSFARKSEKVVSSHDLGRLLDQTIDLLKTDYDMKKHYDFKQIEIIRQYDKTAEPVACEASKIQQVFINILKNGAEAMAEVADSPKPPRFILRVQDDGAWMRVEIEDNGPGMDEKTRRRIFEPFFTTKPVGKGTGLGLSVSYFIVTDDHGGEMSVHAGGSGGTRFVIRLPKGDQ